MEILKRQNYRESKKYESDKDINFADFSEGQEFVDPFFIEEEKRYDAYQCTQKQKEFAIYEYDINIEPP
jgi:hypothetical protein